MRCGTVCGCEVTVIEMKKHWRNEENCNRQTAKQHWNSSSSCVSDRTNKYVLCNQMGSVVIVQKRWTSKCKVLWFSYSFGHWKRKYCNWFLKTVSPYHTKCFFGGLIKSSLCKGADGGKREVEIKKILKEYHFCTLSRDWRRQEC